MALHPFVCPLAECPAGFITRPGADLLAGRADSFLNQLLCCQLFFTRFSKRDSADTIRADRERLLAAVDPIVIAEAYCSASGYGHIEAISIGDFVQLASGLERADLGIDEGMVLAMLGAMQSETETRRLSKTG